MKKSCVLFLILVMVVGSVSAQTATPTPSEIILSEVAGQTTAFEYASSAGDLANIVLLIVLLFSLWAFFLYELFGEQN